MDTPLRRARPADLDEVMTLEESGFEPGIVESRPVFARRIEAFPEGFLLAGTPAWGYLCAEVWSGYDPRQVDRFDLGHDIGAWLDRGGDTLYVASMTVVPEARGTGRGRHLFQAALGRLADDFPALTRTVLIVNEHWAGARRIYDREGFAETGRLGRFFQPLDGPAGDAVIMERELP